MNAVPGAAGQEALYTAWAARTIDTYVLTYTNGVVATFTGLRVLVQPVGRRHRHQHGRRHHPPVRGADARLGQLMPTKVHEATTEAPVDEAGANGAHRDERRRQLARRHPRHRRHPLRDGVRARVAAQHPPRGPHGRGPQQGLPGRPRRHQALGEDAAELLLQARVVLASMVDADGSHIGDPSQAKALMQKSGAALTRLWLVCVRLSPASAARARRRRSPT